MPMAEEHKARMRAGRERVAREKAERAHEQRGASVPATPVPVVAKAEFIGLTMKNCPVGCNTERCVIGGSLIIKNDDGTTSRVGHCCHPHKGGLGPIHKMKPEIVERF